MPKAIISPSVLASDFGQLSAECKRMMDGGAEWLHMGVYTRALLIYSESLNLKIIIRRYGRVRSILLKISTACAKY